MQAPVFVMTQHDILFRIVGQLDRVQEAGTELLSELNMKSVGYDESNSLLWEMFLFGKFRNI